MTESDAPPSSTAEGMVDNLVTQFSNALHCFRELVQNSIDAGTPRVDIWMEWEPGEGHTGTISIHVEDFGEGMDERVIDQEFTRLFASGKDEDLTKIGKFGIGFVSVFALEPTAVLVHTGRSGEYWEVLFHRDRSFSKTRVDDPVEGTHVTIFLEAEYHRYEELAQKIPETLRHWCSQSTVEITFQDRFNADEFAPPESINEPFEVDGECHRLVEHEGTEIAMAYADEPIYGFYNRGLTLALTDVGDDVLDRWKKRFEFISFKIKSRYLEHTLSRDSVVRDQQYERAMELLEQAANGPLLSGLFDELEELAATDNWAVDTYHRYGRLMRFLAREPADQIVERAGRPILRCLNSGPMTLKEAWNEFRDRGRLVLSDEATPLVDRLGRRDISVIMGAAGGPHGAIGGLRSVGRLLARVFAHKSRSTPGGWLWRAKRTLRKALTAQFVDSPEHSSLEGSIRTSFLAPEAVYYPVELDEEPAPPVKALLGDAVGLLKAADVDVPPVHTGTISAPREEEPFVMVAEEAGGLMEKPFRQLDSGWDDGELVVNRSHPQFEVIIGLYDKDPAMGAYMLARSLYLSDDDRLETGAEMIDASVPDVRERFETRD